jgi:hypothetical protein
VTGLSYLISALPVAVSAGRGAPGGAGDAEAAAGPPLGSHLPPDGLEGPFGLPPDDSEPAEVPEVPS